jgi:hypothetical protein
MAKLKRQTRPMSKADMDKASVIKKRGDGKSVKPELGTPDILRVQVTSCFRVFIVFSGFEVVNPQLVEEPPLEVIRARNAAAAWRGVIADSSAISIHLEANSLFMHSTSRP